MDFISLELNQRVKQGEAESEAQSAPIELINQLQILIRGIGLHTVESGEEQLAQFQSRISEIAESLRCDSSADDLLVAVGRTLRLTEDYNRQAAVVFKGQMNELRAMLLTMTETVQFIVSSSETSVKQLTFMETQLQRANGLEDLRQLKTYTQACLSLVRRESTRLQTETRERIATLKNDVEHLSARLKASPIAEVRDPLTGLPGRTAAEQAIEDKLSAGDEFAMALFSVDRLAAINGRFGRSVGDDFVASCARLLRQRLSGVTLYRWSGPTFVAIFDSAVEAAEAESRARRAAGQQLQKDIEAGDRMVMIVANISCWTQQILPKEMLPEGIFKTMDGFLAVGEKEEPE